MLESLQNHIARADRQLQPFGKSPLDARDILHDHQRKIPWPHAWLPGSNRYGGRHENTAHLAIRREALPHDVVRAEAEPAHTADDEDPSRILAPELGEVGRESARALRFLPALPRVSCVVPPLRLLPGPLLRGILSIRRRRAVIKGCPRHIRPSRTVPIARTLVVPR